MITIDAEEDNWHRAKTSITLENIDYIGTIQKIFDTFELKPIYLCTYSVVNDAHSVEILKNIFSQKRCDIGTHLHPWNCPPFEEDFTDYNSHLKNLPDELIYSKIVYLTNKIQEEFNVNPTIFRAGRWGSGNNVLKALFLQGYKIDTSVTPFINWYHYECGADFREYPYKPYFNAIDTDRKEPEACSQNILELPVSIGFNRVLFYKWSRFQNIMEEKPMNYFKINGILSRLNLLKKIWLSPEFNNASEMIQLTKMIVKNNANFINFTFHSPSLKPGLSPFVKTQKDLKNLLCNTQNYFEWLFLNYTVIPVTSINILPLVNHSQIMMSDQ
jgi:hypothetical protein